MRAFAARDGAFDARLVHTGQHYDVDMNDRFFEQLRIPRPQVSLEVGSGSHAVQTAEIMKRFEPVLDQAQPRAVLVVGDVNSTIACALVAAKKGIKVIHVEAGLRSRDRSMPEEINRILTDQLSDRLYVTEAEAIDNLVAEGVAREKCVFAGNVMIDTLLASLSQAIPPEATLQAASAEFRSRVETAGSFALLTLHRPSNVDDVVVLRRLGETLQELSTHLPIVFPVHPRTRERIAAAGLDEAFGSGGMTMLPPLGYLEMLGLLARARVVLTDSGGLQEETTALGIPCLTLRENTERPITITQGSNRLVGSDPDAIRRGLDEAIRPGRAMSRPEKWDGRAAERIVADLAGWLGTPA
jgi:UDP-N-acetylglucosamine 2-epimerase (non-hydrolysing)